MFFCVLVPFRAKPIMQGLDLNVSARDEPDPVIAKFVEPICLSKLIERVFPASLVHDGQVRGAWQFFPVNFLQVFANSGEGSVSNMSSVEDVPFVLRRAGCIDIIESTLHRGVADFDNGPSWRDIEVFNDMGFFVEVMELQPLKVEEDALFSGCAFVAG